ncbi:MAG: heavy-metal-associated domain-containing protein [Sphingobium sp.]|uniref:heavy-metal-associated domain-containing protein n=1 Tax=Sphingobium sp. TaxID=1912891 RepID=UPI0017AAE909|nr:heavy-metal-associated domain-containing protein [Sphingobium sp.]MBU0657251.1 heavy-metal-associated domain-containing protein [Alphaproteobacteria bacterium]MBA4755155.1 heavy-metal-associated domain-containing protein [Sphingobium sp.]MBU1258291.1 heavy-metal-associated domain-containing protein [Alphaproteobacteria bacterium]MBU1462221.1 heavy-metal-associated domain-containing protein [Alphaproteobacteria bacterium]MBU1796444.1 heavy-metal-associated domain-containing protein [Alphapro
MSLSQTLNRLPFQPGALLRAVSRPVQILLAIAIGLIAAALFAQMEGERGVPPIASGGDFEVRGVKVDVVAKDADSARYAGWRMAQRQAWRMLWTRTHGGGGAPALSDSQIEAMVSGIEIDFEQAGPTRYVATLGILFDRARTGQLLGVSGNVMRSPPLLVIPVLWDGGSAVSYERTNEWQKAWARYRTGDSAIDYVRVAGSVADPILLTAGQTGRRGRLWWRVLLDQYGAADVVISIARLDRAYPGGPVTGTFTARYGPDNSLIGSVTLRASNASGVAQMLDEGARRIDEMYIRALNDGRLRPDPSLIIEEPVDPDALAIENATDTVIETDDLPTAASTSGTSSFAIQFDTPDVGSISAGESAVRAIPGVRSASTSSLALGGTSVMQVSFDGTVDMLRNGLQARGYTVSVSGTTLRIVRRQAPQPTPPSQQ